MKKFTKIIALAVIVAAVASLTACGKDNEADDIATVDDVVTVEQTADTAEMAVSDEATAEASTGAEVFIGTWTLAGVNGGTVQDYADSFGVAVEDVESTVVIDETTYTNTSGGNTASVAYTVTETGISCPLSETLSLELVYDAENDAFSYVVPIADSEGNVANYVFTYVRA